MIRENTSDKLFKEVETRLNKRAKLTINGLDPEKIAKKNEEKALLYIFNQSKTRNTLYPSGKVQCGKLRRRSLGDLYCIMRTYFPEITLKEVREYLIKLINTEKLSTMYCHDINKRVYWKYGSDGLLWYTLGSASFINEKDELGFTFRY